VLTEPRPPESYTPSGEPVPCRWCEAPVVITLIGWMHLDQYRALDGWLCPEPHLHIAEPGTVETVEIKVKPHATEPVTGRASIPATAPSPRPRPTPIPPRKEASGDGSTPSEWPPPSGKPDWWQDR
jgi:hypothetical protein